MGDEKPRSRDRAKQIIPQVTVGLHPVVVLLSLETPRFCRSAVWDGRTGSLFYAVKVLSRLASYLEFSQCLEVLVSVGC